MEEFQCLLFVLKWSYLCCYIICMTVPLMILSDKLTKLVLKKFFTAEIWYVFLKFRGQVKAYIWKNFFQMDVLLEPLVAICHCFFLPYPPIAAPNKLQSFFQKATNKIYFATNMMQLLWSLTKYVNAWCYILNFYQEICFKITLSD